MRTALALSLLAAANGCGMTVHMVIANRAKNYFYDPGPNVWGPALIANQTGAMLAGAPYPDYLYACGPVHDNGEFSHWSYFQAFAADYIRQNYPQPWTDEGQKLVAFFFGIVSHYIADINWHGLAQVPNNYGMIETVGGIDFNCTGLCSPAHTASDTGGEFIASYATSLTWDDPNQWVIPTQDLVNIYATANRTVNGSDIEQCALTFYAGSWAIRLLGSLIEPLEINGAPTFTENFIDLPLGGIDDMAVWTGRMWLRWADWVENGPPNVFPDGPGLSVEAEEAAAQKHGHKSPSAALFKSLLRTLAPMAAEAGLVSSSKAAGTGAFTLGFEGDATPAGKRDHALLLARALLAILQQPVAPTEGAVYGNKVVRGESWTQQPAAQALPDTHPSMLAARLMAVLRGAGRGGALDKLRAQLTGIKARIVGGDGKQPVVVSDVELARVLLLLAVDTAEGKSHGQTQGQSVGRSNGNGTIIGSPIAVMASSVSLEYFGASLAAGDYNADGKGDIAIGAFGHTWRASGDSSGDSNADGSVTRESTVLPQSGGFYVQYGPAASNGTAPVLPAPSAFTFSTNVFSRLGWSSCTLDFNADGVDDLAVAAPAQGWAWNISQAPWQADFYYWGGVHVYFGSKAGLPLTAAPNVFITTDVNETHTGLHLACADVSGDGRADLLIGSPMAATNGPAGSTYAAEDGRVDIFYASPAYQQAAPVGNGATLTLDLVQGANLTSNGSSVDAWFGYVMDTWQNVTLPHAQVLARAALGLHGMDGNKAIAALTAKLSSADALEAAGAAADILAPFTAAGHPCAPAMDAVALTANASVTVLFVGAPGHRAAPSYAAVGRVYAFALPPAGSALWSAFTCITSLNAGASSGVGSPALLPAPLFTITGDASINTMGPLVSSKIGAGLAVGHPLTSTAAPSAKQALRGGAASAAGSGIGYVAIGIPVTDGMNSSTSLGIPTAGGAVVLFSLNPAAPPMGDLSWTVASSPAYTRAVLYSGMPDARFGWHVQWADANHDGFADLVVAAPMYTPIFIAAALPHGALDIPAAAPNALEDVRSVAGDITGRESGAVLIYRGGAALISGVQKDAEQLADWRANGDQQWGRLGHSFAFADWDGDGTKELVVAAPRAAEALPPAVNATAEMPGALYVFKPAF